MPTNFPHSSWICSTKPTPQIFHNLNARKFKLKFIQQHHKLPTLPKFMTHQHCSSYTMPKNTTIQKKPQSQDYNMINHAMPQISTKAHNNTITMSRHQILNSKFQFFNPKFQTSNSKSQPSNSKFQTSKIKSFSRNHKNLSRF